ncbi:MAG: hypothetical protein RDV41_04920 [Planctomycetota bacterium]|nr:hypothetical protein [Planctomycetota bacterium]
MVHRGLRRGSVLIVALGVMTVLAVLGFVFLSTTRVERAISRNYVDLVRAKFYAQSGLEYAIGEIHRQIQGSATLDPNYSIAEGSASPWYYGGSTAQGPATALERARLVSFQMQSPPTTGPLVYVGIADLTTPDSAPVPNTQHGVSFFFVGTYSQDSNNNPLDGETHGDYVSLKVAECGGQIYINGEDDMDSSDPSKALPDNIRDLLNNLSAVLQANGVTCPHGNPITANLNLGTRIAAIKNPMTGPKMIMTKSELKGTAYPYLSDHDYEIVAPFITTHAWVDKTTLDPRSLQHVRPHDPTLHYQAVPNGTYALLQEKESESVCCASPGIGGLLGAVDVSAIGASMKEVVFASCNSDRLVSDEYSHSCYHWPSGANDHWSTFPIGSEQTAPAPANLQMAVIQKRAPININSAHRHVVAACFRGLSGVYINRTNWPSLSSSTAWATWSAAPQWEGNGYTANELATIPTTLADWLADRFIEARTVAVGHPFYNYRMIHNWKQFDDFVDLLSTQAYWLGATPNVTIREAQKRIVKANANPNSRINKWNPDLCLMPASTRWGDTDKADLTAWTTEFCYRSGGYFEIESMGRVLGPHTGPPGPTNLRAIVAEQKVCVLAKVYDVIKHNTQRDFVHNMIGGGATSLITTYPENIADNNGLGDLAPTYSNPTHKYFGPPSTPWPPSPPAPTPPIPHYCASAEYDGSIMPATTDKYSGQGTATFFRPFTQDFGQFMNGTAEEGRSLVAPEGNPSRGSQSEMFPDGVFFHQVRRYPNYQSTPSQSKCYGGAVGQNNNIDEFIRYSPINQVLPNFTGTGTIEFWFKPTWTFNDMPQNVYGHTCGSDGGPFYQSWTHDHPTGESGRCFLSAGYATEDGQGDSTGIYRLAMAARQSASCGRESSEITRRHIHTTRGNLSGTWNQGGAPFNGKAFWNDVCPIWGWTYYISYFIPTANDTAPNPKSWGNANKWHHLVLLWSGASSWLLVDGDITGKGTITAKSIIAPPSNHSLFLGCNRFKTSNTNGHPNNCDGTMDGFKVYGTGGYYPPPHRYASQSIYNSWLIQPSLAATPNGNPGGTIANAAWTVWFPANQNPAVGSTQTSSIVVTLTTAGTTGTITSATMGGTDSASGKGAQVDANAALPNIQAFTMAAGNTLSYRIEFNQGGTWITSAPILDDFSVAVALASPKYYCYYFSN